MCCHGTSPLTKERPGETKVCYTFFCRGVSYKCRTMFPYAFILLLHLSQVAVPVKCNSPIKKELFTQGLVTQDDFC